MADALALLGEQAALALAATAGLGQQAQGQGNANANQCQQQATVAYANAIWSGHLPTQAMMFRVPIVLLVLILVPGVYYVFRYRESIKQRIEEIERGILKCKIHRDKNNNSSEVQGKVIRCLELHPAFVEKHKGEWNLISLGQYLSTLRSPSDNEDTSTPKFLKKELEVTIGRTLLQILGRTYGAALLPVLGTGGIDSFLTRASSQMAAWAAVRILSDNNKAQDDEHENENATDQDIAALSLSLAEMVSFLNMNQKASSGSSMELSPLELLRRGEVVSGFVSGFHQEEHEHHADDKDEDEDEQQGFPNVFVLERDFEKTIADMEVRIRNSDGGEAYDPDDRSPPTPTPINERVFPDLYLGWGDAKYSHTKREILVNRLVAVLFTKLSYNYYKHAKNEDDLFEVHFNGTTCRYPDEFLQALIDNGHTVDVCPRCVITSFGAALCVKEDDGSWSNIPLACMLQAGYQRYSDNRSVFFAAPHGGLDVYITGPLIGTTNTCAMQFYVAVEGVCAFHSDADVVVPWLKKASLADVYSNEQAVQAVRMAGLVAVTFSTIATDMELPFGGYGVLGMCNDSVAFIDLALRGETNAYPLQTTGRYLIHIMHCFMKLQEDLKGKEGMEAAVNDIGRLIRATSNIETDLHASPAALLGATKRYHATYPESYFQATADSKEIMSDIAKMFGEWIDTI